MTLHTPESKKLYLPQSDGNWLLEDPLASDDDDNEEDWLLQAPDVEGSHTFGDEEDEENALIALEDWDLLKRDTAARLMLIFGLRGEGKTLLMTYLLNMFGWHALDQEYECTLYSNIDIDFVDIADPNIYQEIAEDPSYGRGFMGWDEVGEVMTSKRPTSGLVMANESNLTMMRKRGIDIFATTQWPHTLTSLFSAQCDFFVRPKMQRFYTKIEGDLYTKVAIHVQMWNWNGSITGHPLFGTRITDLPTPQWSFTFHGVERMWNRYPTGEVVANPHTEFGKKLLAQERENRKVLQYIFGDKKEITLQEFGEKMFTLIDPDTITDDMTFDDVWASRVASQYQLWVLPNKTVRNQSPPDEYVPPDFDLNDASKDQGVERM